MRSDDPYVYLAFERDSGEEDAEPDRLKSKSELSASVMSWTYRGQTIEQGETRFHASSVAGRHVLITLTQLRFE